MSLSSKPVTTSEESNLLGIEADETVSSQEDIPIPYFAGPGKLAAKWIGDVYDRTAKENPNAGGGKGGKGGGGEASKINYGSVVGVFGGPQIERLSYIALDDRIIWEGQIDRDGSNPLYAEVVVPDYGTYRIYWGTSSQTTVDTLVLAGSDDNHPPYRNIPYVVVKEMRFGMGKDAPGNLVLGVERWPQNLPSGIVANVSFEGVNVFGAIYELLTLDGWGLGLDGSQVDVSSWAAASLTARHEESYPLDGAPSHVAYFGHVAPKFSSQTAAKKAFNDLLTYCDGFLRFSEDKIQAGVEEHDGTVSGSLPEVTHHDFVSPPRIQRASYEAVGRMSATFRDRRRHSKVSTHTDDALGVTDLDEYANSGRVDLKHFSTEHQAMRWVSEYLQASGSYLREINGSVFRDALQGRREGDEIHIDYLPAEIDTIFRITRIDETNDPEVVRCVFEQKKGVFQLAYVPPEELRPDIILTPPDAIDGYRIFQLPKAYSGADPMLWFFASRPTPDAVAFKIHFSEDDSTYEYIGEQRAFALKVTLNADIAADSTSFNLTAPSEVDVDILQPQSDVAQRANTLLLVIGSEVFSIGSVTALGSLQYTVNVLRGRYETIPGAHTAATEGWIIESRKLEDIQYSDFPLPAEERFFKLQPYSYMGGPKPLADITAIPYTFSDFGVIDPTDIAIKGAVGGYVIVFSLLEPDIAGARIWYSPTSEGFGEEPDMIYSITKRDRFQRKVRAVYLDDSISPDEAITAFFKIQLYDTKNNLSNIIGPIAAFSVAVNNRGPLVELVAEEYIKPLATAGESFTLTARTVNYSAAVDWSWYRSPEDDPNGTMSLIAGATSNTLAVPTLDVDSAEDGEGIRKYRAMANGLQYDDVILRIAGSAATPYAYIVNDTVNINVDQGFAPISNEGIGSTIEAFKNGVSMTAVSAANSGSAGEYNYWIVLPSGAVLIVPDTFRIDKNTLSVSQDDDTYVFEVWSKISGVDTKIADLTFTVRKTVVTDTQFVLSVATTGPTFYPQPIATEQYFAVVGKWSNSSYISAASIVFGKVDTDGVITFHTVEDDYPSAEIDDLITEAGLDNLSLTASSLYLSGDYTVFYASSGAPTLVNIQQANVATAKVGFTKNGETKYLTVAAEYEGAEPITIEPTKFSNTSVLRSPTISGGAEPSPYNNYIQLSATDAHISTPDSPENSVSGDFEIVVKASVDSFNHASAYTAIFSKWNYDADQNTFSLYTHRSSSSFDFRISTDGANNKYARFDRSYIINSGVPFWLKILYDSSSGTVTMSYALTSNYPSSWTSLSQISSTIQAGDIPYNSSSKLILGSTDEHENDGSDGTDFKGKIYYAVLKNGAGTKVAEFNAGDGSNPSFDNVAGQTAWTNNGGTLGSD